MEVRRFKTRDGLCIAADVGGDPADPAVLLIHGTGRTRHTWARTARDLISAGRYVVTIDLRGHGASDWAPSADYSLDAHVGDVADVIESLQIAPTVVGQLAGGWIAIALAARLGPDRVKAVILADVALRFGEEARRRTRSLMLAAPAGFASLEEAAAVLESNFPKERAVRRVANLRRSLALRDDGRWHWLHDPRAVDPANPQRISPDDGSRIEAAARSLTIPTLCIRGQEGALLEPEQVDHLKLLVPQAECVTVAAAGPGVAGEAEEAFDAAIVAFLEKSARRPSHEKPRAGIDAKTLRQALGCFGTGVAIVTTNAPDGSPVGLTINSFTSVSLDPPLVLFCLDRKAGSLGAFEAAGSYAINILHIGQQDLSMRFVQRGVDRFAETAWDTWDMGVPILQDCFASLECERHAVIDGGDHRIFIARVRRVRFDPARDPLLYLQGRYQRIHSGS